METNSVSGLLAKLRRCKRRGTMLLNITPGICLVTWTAVVLLYFCGPLRNASDATIVACLGSPIVLVSLLILFAPRDIAHQIEELKSVHAPEVVWAFIDILEHQGTDVRAVAAKALSMKLQQLDGDEVKALTPTRAQILCRLLVDCYHRNDAPFDIHLAEVLMSTFDRAGSHECEPIIARLASGHPGDPNKRAIRDLAQTWLNATCHNDARSLLRSDEQTVESKELLRIPESPESKNTDLLRPFSNQ